MDNTDTLLQVGMVLQTMDVIKTVTRGMDKHYILTIEPGNPDFDTFDRQTAIIIDRPSFEETVMVDSDDGPTPAMRRSGYCIGVERGRVGGLVVFHYDEIVDKSTAHIYQRKASFEVLTPVELFDYVSAEEFAKAAADIVNSRMTKLRRSADDLNGKWLVLRHVSNGSVAPKFVEEAIDVISSQAKASVGH
jgi:hypothetical protein